MAKWNMKCYVSLTGGEPFLKPEVLFYLMDLIENSDNFQNIAVLTNGTLMTDKLIEKLKTYKKLSEFSIKSIK